jgi:hypothetical protein
MRALPFVAIAVWAAIAPAGIAAAQPLECAGTLKPHQVAELFFGRKIGTNGFVTRTAWRRFLAREVTPRFPDGLTVIEAYGQWRDPATMRISREPSTVVVIAMPGATADYARLNEIAEAYKTRFRQQSVGIIVRPACAAF